MTLNLYSDVRLSPSYWVPSKSNNIMKFWKLRWFYWTFPKYRSLFHIIVFITTYVLEPDSGSSFGRTETFSPFLLSFFSTHLVTNKFLKSNIFQGQKVHQGFKSGLDLLNSNGSAYAPDSFWAIYVLGPSKNKGFRSLVTKIMLIKSLLLSNVSYGEGRKGTLVNPIINSIQ